MGNPAESPPEDPPTVPPEWVAEGEPVPGARDGGCNPVGSRGPDGDRRGAGTGPGPAPARLGWETLQHCAALRPPASCRCGSRKCRRRDRVRSGSAIRSASWPRWPWGCASGPAWSLVVGCLRPCGDWRLRWCWPGGGTESETWDRDLVPACWPCPAIRQSVKSKARQLVTKFMKCHDLPTGAAGLRQGPARSRAGGRRPHG